MTSQSSTILPPTPLLVIITTSNAASPTASWSNNNNRNINNDDFQVSGGYIYMIMSISIMIAVVFFGRVCLAKRREKMRRQKDLDCEVPPGYAFHLVDIPIFDAHSADLSQNRGQCGVHDSTSQPISDSDSTLPSHIPSSSSTTTYNATTIQHPPVALTSSSSVIPTDPPSYDSLHSNYRAVSP